MKFEYKCRSKVCIEETLWERKTLQRVAHSGEKRIIYNVPMSCNEEMKNRSLIIPPERAVGESEWMQGTL
jgi:hypothetical protein